MDFNIKEIEELTCDDILAFIEQHSDEIESIFPHFDIEEAELSFGYKLMDGDTIIGLLVYIPKGLEAHIELDYLVADYRDKGVGKEFFETKIEDFKNDGYEEIIALTDNAEHQAYLRSLNFQQSSQHKDRFFLELA